MLKDRHSCQPDVETVLEGLDYRNTRQNEDHLGLYENKCRAFYSVVCLAGI